MMYKLQVLILLGMFNSQNLQAFGGAPGTVPPPAVGPAPPAESQGSDGPLFQKANVTYDLTRVHDLVLRKQLLAALKLGYQAARPGNQVQREIDDLRGTGESRVIRFFSDEGEENPGGIATGAPALASWQGPFGSQDMQSPPGRRTDLRVFMRAGQPYWYLVNSVWHELLHLTLLSTHHQTTPEGTMPQEFVNDGLWYRTINRIMLDFPSVTRDPISGERVELYDVSNSPWS